MEFIRFQMAKPDKKTLLIEQAYKDVKETCKNFQDNSGASNADVKALLKEIIKLWETEEKNHKFGFR